MFRLQKEERNKYSMIFNIMVGVLGFLAIVAGVSWNGNDSFVLWCVYFVWNQYWNLYHSSFGIGGNKNERKACNFATFTV